MIRRNLQRSAASAGRTTTMGTARPVPAEARQPHAPQGRKNPFHVLSAGLPELLRSHLGAIVEEIVQAIRTGIPEYTRPMDGRYMHVVRKSVETALRDLLARMAAVDPDAESVRATYRGIGRGEAEEGRSLDSFQSALRLGARITWRSVNALAEADRVPPPELAAFGEALLLHLDEVAAAASAGYAEARLDAAGELQMRRDRLMDLLLAHPPAGAEAVSDLAHAAQWRVPTEIAVVVTDHPPAPGTARPIVPREFLARFDERPGRIVVPDPEGQGRARAIAAATRGMNAVIGPTVPLADGARSLRWALDALDLTRRGVLPDQSLVRCTDHLATLLLFRDEALVDALAARHLAPLAAVRPPQRERLEETLLCWLRSGHNASEVAARLAVHPQTVRYRLRQLDEVLGKRLYDADAQFEMLLALHARSLRPAGE